MLATVCRNHRIYRHCMCLYAHMMPACRYVGFFDTCDMGAYILEAVTSSSSVSRRICMCLPVVLSVSHVQTRLKHVILTLVCTCLRMQLLLAQAGKGGGGNLETLSPIEFCDVGDLLRTIGELYPTALAVRPCATECKKTHPYMLSQLPQCICVRMKMVVCVVYVYVHVQTSVDMCDTRACTEGINIHLHVAGRFSPTLIHIQIPHTLSLSFSHLHSLICALLIIALLCVHT